MELYKHLSCIPLRLITTNFQFDLNILLAENREGSKSMNTQNDEYLLGLMPTQKTLQLLFWIKRIAHMGSIYNAYT